MVHSATHASSESFRMPELSSRAGNQGESSHGAASTSQAFEQHLDGPAGHSSAASEHGHSQAHPDLERPASPSSVYSENGHAPAHPHPDEYAGMGGNPYGGAADHADHASNHSSHPDEGPGPPAVEDKKKPMGQSIKDAGDMFDKSTKFVQVPLGMIANGLAINNNYDSIYGSNQNASPPPATSPSSTES